VEIGHSIEWLNQHSAAAGPALKPPYVPVSEPESHHLIGFPFGYDCPVIARDLVNNNLRCPPRARLAQGWGHTDEQSVGTQKDFLEDFSSAVIRKGGERIGALTPHARDRD
jgi:hypothetical protein